MSGSIGSIAGALKGREESGRGFTAQAVGGGSPSRGATFGHLLAAACAACSVTLHASLPPLPHMCGLLGDVACLTTHEPVQSGGISKHLFMCDGTPRMMKIESHHEAQEERQGASDFVRFVIMSKKIIGVNLYNLWL